MLCFFLFLLHIEIYYSQKHIHSSLSLAVSRQHSVESRALGQFFSVLKWKQWSRWEEEEEEKLLANWKSLCIWQIYYWNSRFVRSICRFVLLYTSTHTKPCIMSLNFVWYIPFQMLLKMACMLSDGFERDSPIVACICDALYSTIYISRTCLIHFERACQ